MELSFSPFPNLQTQRLHLRQLRLEDAPEILILRSDPIVIKYTPIKVAKNLDDAQAYIEMINGGVGEDEWIFWGICQEGSDQLIGSICIWNIVKEERRGEIGYVLLPAYHRQGLMSEAVKAVLQFAFEHLGFNAIDAKLAPLNTNSVGLLKKLDFVLDAGFKDDKEARYVKGKE